MTNKLTTTVLLLLIATFISAQIEEFEPESGSDDPTVTTIYDTDSKEEEVSDDDYKDTWKSPNVSDDMTEDSEQNKSWKMGEYKYSAKPKNSWELGLHFGHFFIDGDVDRNIPSGFGAGLHLRKSLNYIFSLRFSAFYGVATGLERQPWSHRSLGGGLVEPVFDSYNTTTGGPGVWFPSHQTTYIAANTAVVLNIGNLLFHKERNKWNWYATLGLGLDHNRTKLDLLGSDDLPYESLSDRVDFSVDKFNTLDGRNDISDALDEIYDGVYETDGFKKVGIFRFGDDINVHVVFIPSMGIARKISKRINIALEHQLFLSDNDHLDGIKFRTALDQTNNVDIGHYTHMRIGINIGNFDKVTEPLYWMNAYDAAFSDVASLKSQPKLDLVDEDNDGVIDMMDQELDTPSDCPVDTRGVRLDSDGDGVVDCEDKEPYSRPGCPIDEDGVANCEEECCADEDELKKIIDQRTSEIKNELISEVKRSPSSFGIGAGGGSTTTMVERTVTNPDGTTSTVEVPVVTASNMNSGCGQWFLPMIHFDLNRDKIKPEYFSHLHNVAQVLKKCPEVCVVAQGHTDSRNSNDYNRVLSYKRAKSAVDYLVDSYGIDRSRIKLMYGGEDNPMITAPDSEAHHFMNRRVEFRTCEPNDFDMAEPDGYNGNGVQSSGNSRQEEYYNGNKTSGY